MGTIKTRGNTFRGINDRIVQGREKISDKQVRLPNMSKNHQLIKSIYKYIDLSTSCLINGHTCLLTRLYPNNSLKKKDNNINKFKTNMSYIK